MKKRHIYTLLVALLFVALAVGVLVYNSQAPQPSDTRIEPAVDSTIHIAPTPKHFGVDVDTFMIKAGEIKSGQSFGGILGQAGISSGQVFKIAEQTKSIFDVRKLRAGKPYSILQGKKSASPQYFIYQESLLKYYVISLKDSIYAVAQNRTKTIREKEVSGAISGSLSATLNNSNLTNKLSGIYAWTIDFFRIQKGDSVHVIYQEIYVDDTVYAGIGDILAAKFVHFNDPFYAFRYTDSTGQTDYFDETGRSLRKAFLKAPLKFSRISSRYTMKRFHPVQKRWKAHLGTDYAAPRGTPIMSTADGVISKAGYTSGNGNYVKVRHNSVYSTQYLHMSKIGKGIKKGVRVRQGDVIGYVGSTGLATGPHVCYRFWKNGKQVDPYKQKLPDANPINDAYRADYLLHIESLKPRLD